MTKIYVDADACPVKAEVEKTATRHKIPVFIVSNGGIRPSQNPIITMVVVDQGADVADQWIADHCGTGDIVVTSDIPLAARAIEHESFVVKPNGEILTSKNIDVEQFFDVKKVFDVNKLVGNISRKLEAFLSI